MRSEALMTDRQGRELTSYGRMLADDEILARGALRCVPCAVSSPLACGRRSSLLCRSSSPVGQREVPKPASREPKAVNAGVAYSPIQRLARLSQPQCFRSQ